jgi:hypothetical protein
MTRSDLCGWLMGIYVVLGLGAWLAAVFCT